MNKISGETEMISEIKIEHDVPVPDDGGKWTRLFRQMKIGDSFEAPKQLVSHISGSALHWTKRNTEGQGRAFKVRTTGPATCRCWRVK